MDDSHWKGLIEAFVAGRLDGPAFERLFLETRRGEVERGLSQRYAVDLLFYEVDAFCADPELRDEHDIDEPQLRAEAQKCLLRWDEPWPRL